MDKLLRGEKRMIPDTCGCCKGKLHEEFFAGKLLAKPLAAVEVALKA
jgi:hypothetical protein